jgi:hypothetical protein
MSETNTKKKSPVRAKIGIYEALMNFQSAMPTLPQNKKEYRYTYTDLLTIINTAQPILAYHGLVITQPIAGSRINTILHHIPSKEEICSFVDIPQDVNLKGMNTFQVYGSALTYFRRYSYISILSIVSDADLDASGTEIKPAKVSNALPTLSDSDFQKLLGAFGKEDKNGNLVDDNYAVERYSLSPVQIKTIKEVSNG